MKVNPEYQALLPKLSQKEYDGLKESMKNEGQHYPIIVNSEGIILDGHNRYQICQELGLEPKTQIKNFENILLEKKFVIESNLRRRQLNDFQKAEMGMILLEIEKDRAKARMIAGKPSTQMGLGSPAKATETVSKQIGLSKNTFERAKKIIEKAPEEVKKKVREGKQTINSAYSQINEVERLEKRNQELEKQSVHLPENVTIRNGDFSEVQKELPSGSIQLMLTDPPYREKDLPLWDKLADVADRLLVPGGFLIAYCPHYHLPTILSKLQNKLEYFWVLTLSQKQATIVQSRHVYCHWKPIIIFNKKPLTLPAFFGDKIEGQGREKDYHPDQQGVAELESLITNFCPENGVILDPFAGSGTTLIAAKKLGRRSIGIEIDQTSYESMKERLSKA